MKKKLNWLLFFALTHLIIWKILATAVGLVTDKVAENIVSIIRNDVLKNDLVKVGLLIEQFSKSEFKHVRFVKNGVVVINNKYDLNFFDREKEVVVFLDEEGRIRYGEFVFVTSGLPYFSMSLMISLLIVGILKLYIEKRLRHSEELMVKKMTDEKNSALVRQAKEFVHDIKSPLVALELSIAEIGMYKENEAKESKGLKTARLSILRIKEIGSQFIESQSLNENWVELILIKKEITSLIQEKEIEHGIQIELVVNKDAEDSKTLASRNVFKRILSNVINNSVESIKEGLRIKIEVKRINEKISISIKDNGFGFPECVLNNKDFVPLSSKGKNRGIGLSSAYFNVKKWNGDFVLANNIDGGASVELILKNFENYQVILIDDDELNRIVWESEARKIKSEFNSFSELSDLALEQIKKRDALVYLDSNLKNGVRGESLIPKIKNLSLVEVKFFIETGNDKSLYKDIPDISGVSDKRPNWLS